MEIEDDTWLLKEAKKLCETNVWKARSFLITARSLCPSSLKIRLAEYRLELVEDNVSKCSQLLKEMFDDFAGTPELWVEVIPLVQDVQKSNNTKQNAIFKSLPASTQQKMITNCAEFNPIFIDQCNLYLLLIKHFPNTAPEYGLSLAERLVQKEKDSCDGDDDDDDNGSVTSSACNQLRKMLVRQLLPLLATNPLIHASNKQYYKWLQKSIEHYTTSYASSDSSTNFERSWHELGCLRNMIGIQCSWRNPPKPVMRVKERMEFLRRLYEEKRSGSSEEANIRKQVFYSSIALLMETSSKYMKTLDSSIYVDQAASDAPAYIILPNAVKPDQDMKEGDDSSGKESTTTADPTRNSKLNEYFFVASECMNLLNSDDGFEKDFSLLTRRWKIERWTWYQLFLANVAIFEEEYHLALSRLTDLEQRLNDDDNCTVQYKQRVYCHLAMVNFSFNSTQNAQRACECACEFIKMFSKRDISSHVERQLIINPNTHIYPLSLTSILPIFIHNFIISVKESAKFQTGDDDALGHVLVLSQHDWPRRRCEMEGVVEKLKKKKIFHLSKFLHSITNVEMVEELAKLHNDQLCMFQIGDQQSNSSADQVTSVFVDCVNRRHQPIDHVIVDYLVHNRELISNTLSADEEDLPVEGEEC